MLVQGIVGMVRIVCIVLLSRGFPDYLARSSNPCSICPISKDHGEDQLIFDHIGSLLVIAGTFDSNEETPEDKMGHYLEDMRISPYRTHFIQDTLKFPS